MNYMIDPTQENRNKEIFYTTAGALVVVVVVSMSPVRKVGSNLYLPAASVRSR